MDAIFESVKEKLLLSGFLRSAVEEAVHTHGVPRDAVAPHDVVPPLTKRAKLEDLNGEDVPQSYSVAQLYSVPKLCPSIILDKSADVPQSYSVPQLYSVPKLCPSIILDKSAVAVKKLFDKSTDEFLGSFVFVQKTMGITAFHSVVQGQHVLNGSTLAIDGLPMEHVVSYPYYDLSFYNVPGRLEENFLELGSEVDIYKGRNFYVAAYPALDAQSSKLMDEEVLITPGAVTRHHHKSDFITGAYKCCKGSSGGAVLTKDGKLIGMHLQNEFYEDSTHHSMSEIISACPEDYKIKAPKTFFRYGKRVDHAGIKFDAANALKLSRYAASNVAHKSSFGVFLSVNVIEKKLNSLLIMKEQQL